MFLQNIMHWFWISDKWFEGERHCPRIFWMTLLIRTANPLEQELKKHISLKKCTYSINVHFLEYRRILVAVMQWMRKKILSWQSYTVLTYPKIFILFLKQKNNQNICMKRWKAIKKCPLQKLFDLNDNGWEGMFPSPLSSLRIPNYKGFNFE
jgi:hypothetical protein